MTRILVTGGTGYIGSHTVVELLEQGFEPVIVDNLCNSNRDVIDRIAKITGKKPAFFELDLCNEVATQTFFEAQKAFAGAIHFAAVKAVGESVQKPILYYKNNLNSLMNVLEGMSRYPKAHIIFSSSATVYGEAKELPVNEQSPILEANSPYGNTKQICEEIMRDTIHANSGLTGIALRYFNPVGAHDSALIGELPSGVPNNLMPFITQTAIGKRKLLRVFGDDYDTPDGTCVRDYIHVVDLAKAHVIAIKRLLNEANKTPMEIFNLGTGKGYSVMEMIKTFEKVSGVKLNYQIADRRVGDVASIYADTTLANNELGWKAEKELEDMVLASWRWEEKLGEGI